MVDWVVLALIMRSLFDFRYSLQTKGRAPTQLELLDLVTAKLDDQTILLLGRSRQSAEFHPVYQILPTFSPHMEIRPDYFNRVRMNTVVGRQVNVDFEKNSIKFSVEHFS